MTGGPLIETDGAEVAPGSVQSGALTTYATPGQGSWETLPASPGYYFAFDSLNVNADGSLNSRRTTQVTISLKTDTNGGPAFTGTYTTTVTTPNGGGTVTTTGNVEGSLIPVPTLP